MSYSHTRRPTAKNGKQYEIVHCKILTLTRSFHSSEGITVQCEKQDHLPVDKKVANFFFIVNELVLVLSLFQVRFQ